MADSKGRFVWHELMTTDFAAAAAFYKQVVGWEAADGGMPGMNYWIFSADKQMVAGLMDLPAEAKNMGTPPSWVGYVAVDDVDATAAMATAHGGKVYVPPTDIPNVGRFSIIADPDGAALGLLKSANPEQDQPAAADAMGRVGWNELHGGDASASLSFYSTLFAWKQFDSMDMGPAGPYLIYGTPEVTLGGMMKKDANEPQVHWSYYINVANINEAADRVKAAGGQVTFGPEAVPGGAMILTGLDPQGAAFALIQGR